MRTDMDVRSIEGTDPVHCKPAPIVRWDAPDADLLFCRQIGLHWVRVLCADLDPGVDALCRVQQRLAAHGLQIWSVVHVAHRSLRIQLGRPGRDEDPETHRTFIRSLGALSIPVAAYDFHLGNTFTTAIIEHHGYLAREFDLEAFLGEVEARRFGRQIPAEEVWENYAYFLRAVLPAAEEAGVVLAHNPDDPPLAHMNGVAKLFTTWTATAAPNRSPGGARPGGSTCASAPGPRGESAWARVSWA